MTELKDQLAREIFAPLGSPELNRRYRVPLPNGILFYGPPDCGSAYFARKVAEELGWHFEYYFLPCLEAQCANDLASGIRTVFCSAVEQAPSIIFIDEFETLVPTDPALGGHQQPNAEAVGEFLAGIEGCAERRVLVIAATDEPEKIHPAMRRSGRLDRAILIPPPDVEARRVMLEFHLRDRPLDDSLDIAGVASLLEGYSPNDLRLLVDEAARIALTRTELITTDTLLAASERVTASVTAEEMSRYRGFQPRGTR